MKNSKALKEIVTALHNDKSSNDKEKVKKDRTHNPTAAQLSKAAKNDKAAKSPTPPTVVPPDRQKRIDTLAAKKNLSKKDAAEAVDGAIAKSQDHSENIEQSHVADTARVIVSKDGQKAYFVQGDTRFEVDVKDLNKVVGCNGESCPLDRLMDSEIVALAQANKLPVQPYSRELLRPVLVGLLQTTWYRDIDDHTSAHLDENQRNRIEWYLHALKKHKEPTADSDGSRKPRAARQSAGKSSMLSKSFRVLKDAQNVPRGRESALLSVVKKLKSASFSQIVEAAKNSDFKTKQDFEQQVARFLKELVEHHAIEEV